MTETPTIRRRKDGSIDTGYYMAAARQERSETAHALKPKATTVHRGIWSALVAVIVVLPFFGGQG